MKKRHAGGGLKGLCLTAMALAPAAALAEEVRLTLRNGGSVCGVITSEAGGTVTLMTPQGSRAVPSSQVAARRAEECGGGQAAAAGASGQNRAATQAAGAAAGTQTAQAPARPAGSQLPAGREVRMAGVADIGELLIPDLVDGYIAGMGLRPRGWSQGATPEQRFQEGRDGRGQPQRRVTVERMGPGDAFVALGERRADLAMSTRAAERTGSVAGAAGAGRRPRHRRSTSTSWPSAASPWSCIRTTRCSGSSSTRSATSSPARSPTGTPSAARTGRSASYARDAAAGATEQFAAEVMRDRQIAANAERLTSSAQIANNVAAEPGAIGFTGISFIGRSRALNLVASCGIEFPAGSFEVKTQDYPLERRLLPVLRRQGQPDGGGLPPLRGLACRVRGGARMRATSRSSPSSARASTRSSACSMPPARRRRRRTRATPRRWPTTPSPCGRRCACPRPSASTPAARRSTCSARASWSAWPSS